jgi:hypothetical protein
VSDEGKRLYVEYRIIRGQAGEKRGHQANIPRWQNVKPWVRGVWSDFARRLTEMGYMTDQQHSNQQVRRLREEGRCPTCGAEEGPHNRF